MVLHTRKSVTRTNDIQNTTFFDNVPSHKASVTY